MRQAGGRHFADVVIGVSPDAVVGQGHAAADAVEEAVQRALPESDVVVHVEPAVDEAALRERVHAAALSVPGVREVHNLRVVALDDGLQVALHLKLPGDLPLEAAHEIASKVERAIGAAVPEVVSVQTHLEPLREPGVGRMPEDSDVEADAEAVATTVKAGITPSDILTKKAFENAIVTFSALGGSTNAVLHLLAIAHAAGVRLTLFHRPAPP